MPENEEAISHQQRLVEQINQQRMSAQKVEEIHPLPENFFLAVLLYNSPKEISEGVDENPRDYRKVVGRAEAAVGKSDEGYIFELIEKVGQVEQLDIKKADITATLNTAYFKIYCITVLFIFPSKMPFSIG